MGSLGLLFAPTATFSILRTVSMPSTTCAGREPASTHSRRTGGWGDRLAKHDVLVVQPVTGVAGDEKLATIRIGPGVGHGEEAGACVLEIEVLVVELVSVHGDAARPVALDKVAALAHEALDDAVE